MVYYMALPRLSLLSKFIPNEIQKIQIEVHLAQKSRVAFTEPTVTNLTITQ
jgi:hypothetical protein